MEDYKVYEYEEEWDNNESWGMAALTGGAFAIGCVIWTVLISIL